MSASITAMSNTKKKSKNELVVEAVVENDGQKNPYVSLGGVRIAKRGHPDTPQAGTWISLEPGFAVYDNADLTGMVIHHEGVSLQ